MSIQESLATLIRLHDLSGVEAEDLMRTILSGKATDAQIGAILTALSIKDETSIEIASFAKVMRSAAVRVPITYPGLLVDTCGTGGDASNTFNISTTAAFVAAGAGVPIVKHGNRSITSRCGSADVLEELGIHLSLEPSEVRRIFDRIQIVFLFAPQFHPAMKRVMGPRKELGFRTIFNLLGPLVNPAGAHVQLIGVYTPRLCPVFAHVLRDLGLTRGMVVHGSGLDEISVTGATTVSELRNGTIRTYEINCEDFGIKRAPLDEIRGGSARVNAKILLDVLRGRRGAQRDIVLMNAGAAIYLGGCADSLAEGVETAADSIDSGRAFEKLTSLIKESGGA